MECPHLSENIKLEHGLNFETDLKITKNFECSECGVRDQNWLCLHCGSINCGRYVNGHAKVHAEALGHQICLSCDVYSVYCYKCDDYISNDTDNQAIDKIRQSIIRQKNNETELNTEQMQVASLSHSSSDMYVESYRDTSTIEDISRDNKDLGEIGDSLMQDDGKSKALLKAEESARNLRSRSRKRSYSGGDSSTESQSSHSAPRLKEKKHSPLNGKATEKKVVGLKNLGNTCFMNAVLQSLSNIQEFSCYFSTLPSLEVKANGKKVYHSRSYTRQEMQEVIMAEELRKVLINLNAGGCGSKGAISPECLFLVIWKVVPRFRGYQQQDAHEFLRYMLDRLHTELLQLLPAESKDGGYVTSPRPGSASIVTSVFGGTLQSEELKDGGYVTSPRPGSASIVTSVFGGTLQREVRCLACGTDSKKFDPFLDLSLELPETNQQDPPVALFDCLDSFVQVEELADTERYYCNSCKCKQKSTKQIRIRRLPNVLCLHLKRFRWSNYFRIKVDTGITFPIKALNMSQFVLGGLPETRRSRTSNNLYDLAAVIVHHGSGAGSGHYTAFAINEEQWFHFNDQTVRPTDAETVATCKPYILFYIRRELSLPHTPPL